MDKNWSPEREWLVKAESDLAAARMLGSAAEPLLDTAIYHCQQVGEKALKAVLARQKKPLQRTHDLEVLLNEAVVDCPELEVLRAPAGLLSPYAVKYRYPGDEDAPPRDEFDEALVAAEMILEAVRRQTQLRPPQNG